MPKLIGIWLQDVGGSSPWEVLFKVSNGTLSVTVMEVLSIFFVSRALLRYSGNPGQLREAVGLALGELGSGSSETKVVGWRVCPLSLNTGNFLLGKSNSDGSEDRIQPSVTSAPIHNQSLQNPSYCKNGACRIGNLPLCLPSGRGPGLHACMSPAWNLQFTKSTFISLTSRLPPELWLQQEPEQCPPSLRPRVSVCTFFILW